MFGFIYFNKYDRICKLIVFLTGPKFLFVVLGSYGEIASLENVTTKNGRKTHY